MEKKELSPRGRVWAGVVALVGLIGLVIVFNIPNSYERAAREEWDAKSPAEQAELCDAGTDYYSDGPSGDAIRDLLEDEC